MTDDPLTNQDKKLRYQRDRTRLQLLQLSRSFKVTNFDTKRYISVLNSMGLV